ncbi:long-chain-fatty-acid--CoA ligase [Desertibaculum subflavum]|uniref:long-chain-fatty-acid--CoA ligase n=1 Tax=Desertibaculum subflavum TaxID=2268458 RepID=UPI000E675FCB
MPHVWEKTYPPGIRWDMKFEPTSLNAFFDHAVSRWSSHACLDFMDKKYSYSDVADQVHRMAEGLQKLGVGPGVQVGLFLPNCPQYVISFFAVHKAGGRVVNLSPLDAERELRHKIDDADIDFIVTLALNALYPNVAKMLGSTRLKKVIVSGLEEVLPFPKNLLFPLAKKKEIAKWPRDDRHVAFKDLLKTAGKPREYPVKDPKTEVALLQYTGGTTGVPKAAMLTHANLTCALQMFDAWTAGGNKPLLEEGKERCLVVLPLFHIYALTAVFLRSFSTGAEMVLHPRFELKAVMQDLAKKKITVFPGVPTMFAAINAAPDVGSYDLRSLKYCGSGGAPLPVDVLEKFEGMTGCKLSEGWGMTETSPAGTSQPLYGERRKGSCGLPLPGVLIEIVDVDEPTKLLGIGDTGEICISGPNVMQGYWKNPKATEEAFAGGRFHTGDVGKIDQDGFVFITDRKKDMILSGGFNVYPRNIEEAVYEHPAVAECTVIGVPDDYRGQSAKVFVKLKPGMTPFTFDELKTFLGDKLAKYEIPVALEIRPELPKTIIGKLSKKELVEEERRKYEAAKAEGKGP